MSAKVKQRRDASPLATLPHACARATAAATARAPRVGRGRGRVGVCLAGRGARAVRVRPACVRRPRWWAKRGKARRAVCSPPRPNEPRPPTTRRARVPSTCVHPERVWARAMERPAACGLGGGRPAWLVGEGQVHRRPAPLQTTTAAMTWALVGNCCAQPCDRPTDVYRTPQSTGNAFLGMEAASGAWDVPRRSTKQESPPKPLVRTAKQTTHEGPEGFARAFAAESHHLKFARQPGAGAGGLPTRPKPRRKALSAAEC